jgi:hypothetical protein
MSYLVLQNEESPRYEDAPITTPYRVSTVKHYFPVIGGSIGATPSFRSRNDELRGNLSPTADIVEAFEPAGSITVGGYLNSGIPLLNLSGLLMTGVQGDGTNEVQSLTQGGTISGGTFDLVVTASFSVLLIPWNTTAAGLQALIDAKIRRRGTGFQLGDIVVGGGPFPGTPLTLTFQGTMAATNVAAVTTVDTSLTGSAPDVVVATPTPGVVGTITLPDGKGVPTGAYRWTSTKRSSATAYTAQVIAAYTEQAMFETGQGFAVSTFAMADDGNIEATMLGLVSIPASDPVLTPSYDTPSVYPLMNRDLIVTWATNAGNVSGFTWQIDNPLEATRHRGIRSAYPGKMRYNKGFVTLSGTVTMDEVDDDDRDRHYEGTQFAAQAHYRTRSKIGSSGALYQMFVTVPGAQITGGAGPEELAASRRFGSAYNWTAPFESVAGSDFTVVGVSGLTTLETFV